MSILTNHYDELIWARFTETAAQTDEVIVAAKAGFIAKIYKVIVSSLAANPIFFEHGSTKIGPRIELGATDTKEFDMVFQAPAGLAITYTSTATTTLAMYIGYKYVKETGNN